MIERVHTPRIGLPPGVSPEDVATPERVLPGGAAIAPLRSDDPGELGTRFWNLLGDVSGIQRDASRATQALVRGEPIELHEVMIRQEEARVAFTMLLETRNKLVEAYQEIMRMSL